MKKIFLCSLIAIFISLGNNNISAMDYHKDVPEKAPEKTPEETAKDIETLKKAGYSQTEAEEIVKAETIKMTVAQALEVAKRPDFKKAPAKKEGQEVDVKKETAATTKEAPKGFIQTIKDAIAKFKGTTPQAKPVTTEPQPERLDLPKPEVEKPAEAMQAAKPEAPKKPADSLKELLAKVKDLSSTVRKNKADFAQLRKESGALFQESNKLRAEADKIRRTANKPESMALWEKTANLSDKKRAEAFEKNKEANKIEKEKIENEKLLGKTKEEYNKIRGEVLMKTKLELNKAKLALKNKKYTILDKSSSLENIEKVIATLKEVSTPAERKQLNKSVADLTNLVNSEIKKLGNLKTTAKRIDETKIKIDTLKARLDKVKQADPNESTETLKKIKSDYEKQVNLLKKLQNVRDFIKTFNGIKDDIQKAWKEESKVK